MAKEAVLETVFMTYGDDGILRIRINDGAVIGIAQAKLQFEMIERLCGENKIAVLVDGSASHTITKEAQEFAANNVGNRIATAVVNPNPFSKLTLNLFLGIFRPATPFRMFSNEANAMKWLKEKIGARN